MKSPEFTLTAVDGRLAWRHSSGRILPVVSGGDGGEWRNAAAGPQTTAQLRAEARTKLDEATAIAERASREKRPLTPDEHSTVEKRLSEVSALNAERKMAADREALTAQIDQLNAKMIGGPAMDGGPVPIGRPLEAGETVVDRLKSQGRKVNNSEWRLGVLGALATRNGRALGKLLEHSDGTMLDTGERVDAVGYKDMLWAGANVVLVPDVVSAELIDRLRPLSVVMRLGARVVPMTAETLKVPRITGDPTISWLAEGATVTPSDATIDHVLLTARRLTGMTKFSQELSEDSDPVSVGQVLQTAFSNGMASEIDRVALKGSGTAPEPRGIRNQTGVSVNATAAATTWGVLNERVGVLVAAGVDPARIGVALNAASWSTLFGQLTAAGEPLQRPAHLTQTQILPAGNLAGPATGELYAGDYSEVIIGQRLPIQFQWMTETYLPDGKLAVIPRVRADVAVRHGASFAVRTALSS
jgi:HK97 family phage major capsid protein